MNHVTPLGRGAQAAGATVYVCHCVALTSVNVVHTPPRLCTALYEHRLTRYTPEMAPDHLQRVRRATDHLAAQRDFTDSTERAWRKAITDALAAGASATLVAETAGVSRGRVYQLRNAASNR